MLKSWLFCFLRSVGVHVLVEDVNEFAPKWKMPKGDETKEPLHALTTNVAIEEGQLLEEVRISHGYFARQMLWFIIRLLKRGPSQVFTEEVCSL